MRAVLLLSAMLLGAAGLSGCGTMGVGTPGANGSAGSGWAAAATEIAKDPNCGHTDEVTITLGPIPSGVVILKRHCPDPVAK